MKRSRYLFAEAVVVVIVLILLLLTVFPRFYDAQVAGKIAAAKKDLRAIYEAMEVYRLDNDGNAIQRVLIHGDYRREGAIYKVVTILKHNKIGEYLDNHPYERLSPYLFAEPVPKMPIQVDGNPNGFGPMYVVAGREYRYQIPYATYEAEEALFWFTFYQNMYETEYLAAAHGPRLVVKSRQLGQPYEGDRKQYVLYNPTNGVMSHGFIAEQYESIDPTPTPKQVVSPSPTPWSAKIVELQANVTQAPPRVPISNVSELIERQKRFVSNLECVYRGPFTDNYVDKNLDRSEESQQYRMRAIKGILPGDVSPEEVDRYYEFQKQARTFPIEIGYSFAGWDRQIKRVRTPKGTQYPWEAHHEYILNASSLFRFNHTTKNVELVGGMKGDDLIKCDRGFVPSWFFAPFGSFSSTDYCSFEPRDDGLIRCKWTPPIRDDASYFYYRIDALLDPAVNYMPRKCLFVTQRLKDRLASEVQRLDIWYAELEDFRPIDGVCFPARMNVRHWGQVREDLYDRAKEIPSYTHRGFEVPDVIGGEPVPVFQRQWDLTLISARIDRPIDESRYWPDAPAGYVFNDIRPYNQQNGVTRNYTEEQKKKWRGVGPHTFERHPNYDE